MSSKSEGNRTLVQFGKYVAVGILSAVIDFGILNLLSIFFDVQAGTAIGWINAPGFSLSVISGYFWNKYWVFPQNADEKFVKDFPRFLLVIFFGFIVNSGVIVFLTTHVPPVFGAGASLWLNTAKVLATIVTIFWNFAGYKFFVFKITAER